LKTFIQQENVILVFVRRCANYLKISILSTNWPDLTNRPCLFSKRNDKRFFPNDHASHIPPRLRATVRSTVN